MDFGDEYLAELDHIEVVEKAKEGYESDVPEHKDRSYNDSRYVVDSIYGKLSNVQMIIEY